jgi:acetylornithine deacetylase/succinyl-diaminopimelate desuccinylase-like protein
MRAALDGAAVDDPLFRYTMDVDRTTTSSTPTSPRRPRPSSRDAGGGGARERQRATLLCPVGRRDRRRFYRQRGIDTVGLGPGGENAHGANEAVYVPDLIIQAKIYAETIGALLVRA